MIQISTFAIFILEKDLYPSGRTWASLFSASDYSSEYKYGHEDELSRLSVRVYKYGRSSSGIYTGDVEEQTDNSSAGRIVSSPV